MALRFVGIVRSGVPGDYSNGLSDGELDLFSHVEQKNEICYQGHDKLNGVYYSQPYGIVDEDGLVDIRTRWKMLSPWSYKGAYTEGAGDWTESASDHWKCRTGEPPAAGIQVSLVIMDATSLVPLALVLGRLIRVTVEGLDMVFDSVSTICHHLAQDCWRTERRRSSLSRQYCL